MKTVLVLNSEDVVAMGIESQLERADSVQVVSIPANNVEAIAEEVQRFQPNVVVMVDHLLLSILPMLTELLLSTPEYKIIVVRLQDNKFHVYHKQELTLTEGTNIITALQEA
jgi:DNA-binding NarL/FixJ family response regulator